MSWKDDKNLGSWAFTKQSDKPSYNEGDHIATSDNHVWSMEEGSNVPITPTHKPCGYWHKSVPVSVTPVPPWAPPQDGLWAWFKHNEGSGTIIVNYAGADGANMGDGFLTDNTFSSSPTDQQRNYFWNTTPGFGTCSGNWNNSAKSTGLDSIGRNSGYVSLVAFVKPLGATGFFNSYSMISLGHTGTLNFLQIGWRDSATPNYWSFQPGTILSPTESPTFGEWHCIYAQNRAGSWALGELHVRKSGDPNWTTTISGQNGANAETQQRVATSGSINNSCYVVVGDCLFYCDPTSVGIIGIDQATDIYDNLKSRYGMT